MKNSFLILVFNITFLASCNNDKKIIDQQLGNSETEISNLLDSANISFQSLIEELRNEPSDIRDIKTRFNSLATDFESKIESELQTLNELGKKGEITNSEADEWLEAINTSESMDNYKLITYLIDSLEKEQNLLP